MLEPQSTAFFVLLMVIFGGLLVWLVVAKQVVFRVLAASLAFIPAMVFGIAAVNKYYDYYQTWGALYSDLSGSGEQSVPQLAVPAGSSGPSGGGRVSLGSTITASSNTAASAQTGYLFRTQVTGHTSHITREVYVYLPPQYFQTAYRHYRFPAIELLHGSPGQPASWIDVMDAIPTYLKLLADGRATPAVLVMPDTDGGMHYALQCLNYPGGLQDMTYVGVEVPDWASHNLRVMSPGPAWGIAGYSEGGYCAANIGLQLSTRFGYVGGLSGYYFVSNGQVPAKWRPGGTPVAVANPFARYPRLAARNTPDKYIQEIPIGAPIPAFWLSAGSAERSYVYYARVFQQYATMRLSEVPLTVINGGGHDASVWRAALGPMLSWMTPQLTHSARYVEELATHHRSIAPAVKELRAKAPPAVAGSGHHSN